MKTFPWPTFKHITLWIILLLAVSACSGSTPTAPAAPPPTATPAEDVNGLSSAEAATLRSLEKVSDYPLYVMHYSGEYASARPGSFQPQKPGFAQKPFACSLFAALAQPGDKIYGRNFDWDFSPALLLFTDPPGGYASVSMVDLTFIGISPQDARSLTGLPLAQRAALLSAPGMPFDGMNAYGLAVGMAAVPAGSPGNSRPDPAKPTIGSISIIREILDHARSVDEALALFEQYNIDFTGGPPIHYLIADAGGKAALVEFYQGKRVVLPNEAPWHLATNHLRCIASGDGGCPRYHTLAERLSAAKGRLDAASAMQLLSNVAQGGTQWSIVYNMSSGDGSVVIGQAYESLFPFHLNRVEP